MTLARCRGTTRDGKPCAAKPRPGTDLCPWHDPAMTERRAAWSAKGGRQSSNAARARKTLPAGCMTPSELQGFVGTVMRGTLAGRVEPNVAQAIGALARTMTALYPAAEFEQRLADLERQDGRGA